MRILNNIKNMIKRINIGNVVILFITFSLLVAIGFVFFNINSELKVLERLISIHKYAWKQEMRELNTTITTALNSVIKNDNEQIEVDRLQQEEIKSLVNVLEKLRKMMVENDEKQLTMAKNMTDVIKDLTKQKDKILKRLAETKQIDLKDVENIKKANYLIFNSIAIIQGSGSHIKIENKDYILTCAHLMKNKTDYLWAVDNKEVFYPIELVKIDIKKDLALFSIFGIKNEPYLEISTQKPKEGSEIVVIGNPDDLEDIITNGIISNIDKQGYLFTNLAYFGNSGGAILYKGKIIGVTTQLKILVNPKHFSFANYGYGIKLELIQEFLKGIGGE